MGFKYRPLIYRSVTESLLQKPRLSYSALYKEVKDKAGKNLSHRDYSKHLKMMEEDEILHKEEIATSGKILSTYYSLTKKAIATSQLKILGIDETTLKRRGLFQLIIFFEMFKKTSLITQKQLNGLLKKIGSSLSDLEAIKTSSTSFPRSTTFKPVKGIEIVRLIQTDFKMGDVSDTYYYIVIPGFTVKEFVSYMNKLRKGKEPRPFFSHIDVTDVPFVSDMSYTEEEVMDAIDSFRKQGLIKPITEILPGEMRFDIMDESLKYFLKDIWLVHDIDLRIVYERLVYNGEPTDQDRNYLISFFGKSYADQILANAYNIRKSHKIDKIGYEKEKRIAKDFIESFSNHRRSLVQDILKDMKQLLKKMKLQDT
jgi:DNA-binding HxlR family transcriptional regulator